MSRPMIRIHNSQTDEVIDREMTAAEFKIYEADQAAQAMPKPKQRRKPKPQPKVN
jgi:hypothetical protein